MTLTPFLQSIADNPSLLREVSGQGAGIKSIAGTNNVIESGTSTSALIRISPLLEESNRLKSISAQQGIIKNLDLASQNLVDLGEASKNISDALNQNIEIRESQRKEELEFALGLQSQISEVNERLSGQVSALGQAAATAAATEESQGFFGGFKFPTFKDIQPALLIGGLALVGLFGAKKLLK